jgi:hypothetical protein
MRISTAAVLAVSLLALTACSKPKPQPWKEYGYPAWGFAASFRMAPTVTDTPASAGAPRSLKLEAVQGGTDLVVMVTDASVTDKTDEQLLRAIPQDMIESSGGSVTGHADVASGKVVGRELTIGRGVDPTERARVFVANHRIYQVITRLPTGGDAAEVTQFLNAFHLLGG